MDKLSYISSNMGDLEIHLVKDSRPYVSITVDLGIPNFTVFSIKIPFSEKGMYELLQEAMEVLLDEIITFMLSLNYPSEVCTNLYAAVLACFRGFNIKDSDSETIAHISEVAKDNTVKTFRGVFPIQEDFVNETQEKVITAASKVQRAPKRREIHFTPTPPSKTTESEVARVIRMYRGQTIKSQPRPLYVVVWDTNGKPVGAIQWDNRLVKK